MTFSLRPSLLQIRLETQKAIEPTVEELCALYIEDKIAQKNLKMTAAKIKTLESELATISGPESMARIMFLSEQDRKSREICSKFRQKITYYLNNRQNKIIRKLAHALFPTSLDRQRKCLEEILQKKNPTFRSANLQPIAEEVCAQNKAIQDKTSGIQLSSSLEWVNSSSQKRASPEKLSTLSLESHKKSRLKYTAPA